MPSRRKTPSTPSSASKRTTNAFRTRADSILGVTVQKQLLVDLESDIGKNNWTAVLTLRPEYGDANSSDPHLVKLNKAAYDRLRAFRKIKEQEPKEYW